MTDREESGSYAGSGDNDSTGDVTERPVVQFHKLTNATMDAWTDGGGPQNAVLAELQAAIATLGQEPFDFFIRGASKEKDDVEIALPGKLSLSRWQACVLHQLAGRERAQSHNGHAGILGQCLQGLSGHGQGYCDWNTGKPAEAQGRGLLSASGVGCGSQVEIVLGQINRAAVFRDEAMRVPVLSAGVIELEPRAAGQPDGGDGFMIEGPCEIIEALEACSPKGG